MGFKLGSFLGGAAQGYTTGANLSMDMERAGREGELHTRRMEGLDLELRQRREEEELRRHVENAARAAYQASRGGVSVQDAEDNPGLNTRSGNPYGERGARIDSIEAAANAYAERGRMSEAAREAQLASQMRTALRAEVGGEALERFRSGDDQALRNFYNHLWPDGGRVAEITRGQGEGGATNTFVIERGGQRVTQNMTDEELTRHIGRLVDPARSFAADYQTAMKRNETLWEWNNNPDTKPGGFKERRAKAEEKSAEGLGTLRDAQAEYYRGAKTELTNAQADRARRRAGGDDKPITDKEKRAIDFKLDTAIRQATAPRREERDGKSISIDHDLAPYRSRISARATEILREHNYGVSPVDAGNRAMQEFEERLGKLNTEVEAAFRLADRDRGVLAGDKPLRSLRRGVTAIQGEGFTMQEIKAAAKRAGRDPAEIERALRLPEERVRQIRGTPGLETTPPSPTRSRADEFFRD